jgi:hypothetical protein
MVYAYIYSYVYSVWNNFLENKESEANFNIFQLNKLKCIQLFHNMVNLHIVRTHLTAKARTKGRPFLSYIYPPGPLIIL